MILSTSWNNYLQSRINNKEFDKQQKLILSVTKASNSTEECNEIFKQNASLCYIVVAPITKEILLLHNITEIGESIIDPQKKWVALKGMGPSALAIQFKMKFFENTEDMTLPNQKNINKFSSPLDVNSIYPGSNQQKIRKFVAISTFIANYPNLSPPMQPQYVILHCLASKTVLMQNKRG